MNIENQQLIYSKIFETILSVNFEFMPQSERKAMSEITRRLARSESTDEDVTQMMIIACNTVQGYWAPRLCAL